MQNDSEYFEAVPGQMRSLRAPCIPTLGHYPKNLGEYTVYHYTYAVAGNSCCESCIMVHGLDLRGAMGKGRCVTGV